MPVTANGADKSIGRSVLGLRFLKRPEEGTEGDFSFSLRVLCVDETGLRSLIVALGVRSSGVDRREDCFLSQSSSSSSIAPRISICPGLSFDPYILVVRSRAVSTMLGEQHSSSGARNYRAIDGCQIYDRIGK